MPNIKYSDALVNSFAKRNLKDKEIDHSKLDEF